MVFETALLLLAKHNLIPHPIPPGSNRNHKQLQIPLLRVNQNEHPLEVVHSFEIGFQFQRERLAVFVRSVTPGRNLGQLCRVRRFRGKPNGKAFIQMRLKISNTYLF